MQSEQTGAAGPRMLTLFDDRYGLGAHARLLALLAQPCVSFAEIAGQFGVTRERVRQWQLEFLPDAPSGRARQRLCVMQNARRRLLSDPLFRTFYRHVRSRFEPGQVGLIPTRGGYRSRRARVNGHVVVVKRARLRARQSDRAEVHVLTTSRHVVDFVYYQLGDDDFLFVPWAELPAVGTTFLDRPGSKYQRYRNTFAAADLQTDAAPSVN